MDIEHRDHGGGGSSSNDIRGQSTHLPPSPAPDAEVAPNANGEARPAQSFSTGDETVPALVPIVGTSDLQSLGQGHVPAAPSGVVHGSGQVQTQGPPCFGGKNDS
ncbi:hypothetical protein H1R20_g1887, partial [Candolleomyces eurysporus]